MQSKEPEFRTLSTGSRNQAPKLRMPGDGLNRGHMGLSPPRSLVVFSSDHYCRVDRNSSYIMEIPLEKADSSRATPELQSDLVKAPSHPLAKPIKKRDRSGTNFRKRWRTLVKTGCELHQEYGARVYFSISIPRTRKDFVFRSGKEVSPIQPTELVNNLCIYRWYS